MWVLLWRCWFIGWANLAGRKGIHYGWLSVWTLERGADLHEAQLASLSVASLKSIFLSGTGSLGSPGQRVVPSLDGCCCCSYEICVQQLQQVHEGHAGSSAIAKFLVYHMRQDNRRHSHTNKRTCYRIVVKVHISVKHGLFNCFCQVALTCTPM